MNPTLARQRIGRAAVLSLLVHAAAWLLIRSHPPQRPRLAPVPIVLLHRASLPIPQARPPTELAPEPVPIAPIPWRAVKPPRPRGGSGASASPAPPLGTPPAPQAAPREHAPGDGTAGAGAGTGTAALPGPGSGGGSAAPDGPPSVPAPAPPVVRRAVCPQSAVSYPAEARRRGLEGEVTVRLRVREDGTVGDATIVRSAGPALDEAVLEAVRALRCVPAHQGERAVPVYLPYTVRFVLEDE